MGGNGAARSMEISTRPVGMQGLRGHISRCWTYIGIEHDCGPLQPGRDLQEQLKPLASQGGFEEGEAGDVPTRAVEPRDDAAGDGVAHPRKDDRDRPRSCWTAVVAGVPTVTMMSGCRPTNSCANACIRLMSLPPHLTSIRTLRPTVQPKSASACVNAGMKGFPTGSFSTNDMSTPIRRTRSGCCALATTGHAAAPSPAMNSRRRIRDLPR
jgi:hypothetical protein